MMPHMVAPNSRQATTKAVGRIGFMRQGVLTLISRQRRGRFGMQAAQRAPPQPQPLQAVSEKGSRQNRPRPEGLLRESASAVLRRLAMERPLPAHRALHPSLSRSNAGVKLVLTRPTFIMSVLSELNLAR